MNADPAKPVPVDLDADIEVVANDPRAATPTRSGRLAHTKPRIASGSGAIDPMPQTTPPPIADGVPEILDALEDQPTMARNPESFELPLLAPPEPDQIVPEAPLMDVPQAPPVRRVTLPRLVFVMCVAAVWCAAVFAV